MNPLYEPILVFPKFDPITAPGMALRVNLKHPIPACSSDRATVQACSSGLRKQQGLFTRTSVSKQWQQGLSLYETLTAAAGAVSYEKHQPTAKAVDQRQRWKLSTA